MHEKVGSNNIDCTPLSPFFRCPQGAAKNDPTRKMRLLGKA